MPTPLGLSCSQFGQSHVEILSALEGFDVRGLSRGREGKDQTHQEQLEKYSDPVSKLSGRRSHIKVSASDRRRPTLSDQSVSTSMPHLHYPTSAHRLLEIRQ